MAARRTVSVALEVKAGAARKEIRGAASDVEKLEAAVVDTGHGLDKMSDKASKAGRASEKAAAGTKTAKVEAEAYKRELGQLDRQIDATILHLKTLGREFASTGDKTTLARIKAERTMLSQLRQIGQTLKPEAPGTAGSGFLSGIPASPVLVGSLVAIGAAALPAIGAAVGGAVLGGVGTGGIVGGVMAAGQDPRVGAAASRFGQSFMADFASAGQPFIQPLIHALDELGETGASFTASLGRSFSQLAPLLGPLTKGVDGFVRKLDVGLEKLFGEGAPPVIRALANELPEIGDAIGDMFASISDGSEGATMGFIEFLHIMEDVTRGTGEFIEALSDVFAWEVKTGYGATAWANSWLDGLEKVTRFTGLTNIAIDQYNGVLDDLNKEDADLIAGFHDANDATNDWRGSLRDLRDTTEEMAARLANFNDEIEKYLHKTLGVEEAQIRLKKQWADTVETLREGERTLNINTKAGQDNKQALIDMIQAADAVRVAEYNKTGSLDAANAAYDRQLARLRDMAIKLHFNKDQVDALISSVTSGNAIGGLTVPVTMPGLSTYTARLNYYIQQLGIAKGLAATEFATYREGERSLSRRWGGVTEHAATGTLRDAAVYPGGPTRYAFAEASTGGEAFVPKRGAYGRSMSILNKAAGWYGGMVVPRGTRGGGVMTVVHEHRHTLTIDGTGVMSGIRTEVELLGGDVQKALGSR